MNGYLIYEGKIPNVGLHHCFVNLRAIVTEAVYLNRIPVIRPLRMSPKHNFGVKLTSQWSKYWDLYQTKVYFRNNGEFELMQKPFLFILEEDFKHLKFREDQVYKINHEQKITKVENNKYDLIVRSVSGIKFEWWWFAVPDNIKENVRIKFKVSDDVARISKNIIKRLGWYATVHVRRGDRLKFNNKLKKYTSPQHILNKLKEIVPLKSNVYILTDERDRNYFDCLREHYKIYQYFDFDELNETVSGQQPDNNFLFLIESCIFKNAVKKIETFKSRSLFSMTGEVSTLSEYTAGDYPIIIRLISYLGMKMSLIWRLLP